MKVDNDEFNFFLESIDKYRAVIQNIYTYGCFDRKQLAAQCRCSEDTVKKALTFYNICLSSFIAQKENVLSIRGKGRPTEAKYLQYDRFSINENYLYNIYLWAKIVKKQMWTYSNFRRDPSFLMESPKSTINAQINEFCLYFSEYLARSNKSKCSQDLECIINQISGKSGDRDMLICCICDALSVFGRKAPYSVPAYSISHKLMKLCNAQFKSERLWSFMYDNYDRILYDEAVYTIWQAIQNKKLIGYLKVGTGEKTVNYVIPLMIMHEYNSGRGYLLYSPVGSDSVIRSIRLDKLYKVSAYEPDNDIDFEKLHSRLSDAENEIWLSGDYTRKNRLSRIVLKNVAPEAMRLIRKYGSCYTINNNAGTVTFTVRKADDVKPFIRILGNSAIISRKDNPRLYEEFARDARAGNSMYENGTFPAEHPHSPRKDCAPARSTPEPKKYRVCPTLKLFNKFGSFMNVLAEELAEQVSEDVAASRKADGSAEHTYSPNRLQMMLSDSFSRHGFYNCSESACKIIEWYVQTLGEQYDWDFPSWFSVSEKGYTAEASANYQHNQLLTDIEFEYLRLMLTDPDARAIIGKKYSSRMTEYFGKPAAELNRMFTTRYADRSEPPPAISENVLHTIMNAIHNRHMLDIGYKSSHIICTAYRFTYSLRERRHRLMVYDGKWIMQLNLSRINSAKELKDRAADDSTVPAQLAHRKKYIELAIPQNEDSERRNVFERALRLFGAFERYSWNDKKSSEYVIAVVYYEPDISVGFSGDSRIYRRDTIAADILSLGRFAMVLKEPRFPVDKIEYDEKLYDYIHRTFSSTVRRYQADF